MTKLNVGGAPISSWAVRESLKQLGFERALEQGQIAVGQDGTVTVHGAGGPKFDAPVRTQEDLQNLLKAIGGVASRAETHVPTRQALDIFGAVRDADIENRVNARKWYGTTLTTELRPEFTGGKRFKMPLVKIPAQDALIKRSNANLPGLSELEAFFRQPDGSVLLPMHPQELEHRSYPPSSASLDARNASSERTLHVQLPGAPNALVKLDLAHVKNSMVYRPLGATAGEASIAMTEFLARWVDQQAKPGDAFAFLPEPMTIADTRNDVSAIVRIADPYPPPAEGKKTWLVPMYSLTAPDPDFADQPPMLMRLVSSRPDPKVPPLDYALDTVVGPLIESALRVYLDLGSSAQAHGQNTFLEIGEDGRPSGRIVHSDLEAFWPHPSLAKNLGRADFFSRYGFVHNDSAKESQIWGTFQSYFVSQNLGPIVDMLAKELKLPRTEVSAAVQERIKAGVRQRRAVVEQNPVLAPFKAYLA